MALMMKYQSIVLFFVAFGAVFPCATMADGPGRYVIMEVETFRAGIHRDASDSDMEMLSKAFKKRISEAQATPFISERFLKKVGEITSLYQECRKNWEAQRRKMGLSSRSEANRRNIKQIVPCQKADKLLHYGLYEMNDELGIIENERSETNKGKR